MKILTFNHGMGKPFIMETDASVIAIAGCLLQLNNKDDKLKLF